MSGTKRPKKPPACDACKARRVLCHPQPNGAPCPRCSEKNTTCTTTHVPRGRPRKNPLPSSSGSPAELPQQPQDSPSPTPSVVALTTPQVYGTLPECPDLTPDLVAHLFECFDLVAQAVNPIVATTSIRSKVRKTAFQLNLLPPQSRVLALCIVAMSSLLSFHEAVLGPGPRPKSFSDEMFFSSRADVRNCGVRRAAACRGFHAEALKAAWDVGVILQPSNENAASCLLLDILEQIDYDGSSRPWASAYISHVRALAPMWRTSVATPPDGAHWTGFLMSEVLLATKSRRPILFTRDDQELLCGPDPISAEALLASLEASAETPGSHILYQSMPPFMFQVICLARELWEAIAGDRARLKPLSETAVLKFLSSLTLNYAIVSRLLDRADGILASLASAFDTPFLLYGLSGEEEPGILRRCAYGLVAGFTGLVMGLHREFEYRDQTAHTATFNTFERARMDLLREQTREMTALATRTLARGIRYLPAIHYAPIQWHTVRLYAQFALAEAEAAQVVDNERLRDLATIAGQLGRMCYSLNVSEVPVASLLDRLDAHINNATDVSLFFDSSRALVDMFLLPLDGGAWMDPDVQMIGHGA
ncbi:hypothetical protein C8R43DRAFT_1004318 [Mycena crocata]|nr:hypothetical protein C8R43DRAFT_1004318 [Mycena crocata]